MEKRTRDDVVITGYLNMPESDVLSRRAYIYSWWWNREVELEEKVATFAEELQIKQYSVSSVIFLHANFYSAAKKIG